MSSSGSLFKNLVLEAAITEIFVHVYTVVFVRSRRGTNAAFRMTVFLLSSPTKDGVAYR